MRRPIKEGQEAPDAIRAIINDEQPSHLIVTSAEYQQKMESYVHLHIKSTPLCVTRDAS